MSHRHQKSGGVRRFVSLLLALPLASMAITLPEVPAVSLQVLPDRSTAFSWEAVRDQVYRVERSTTLAQGSWQAISEEAVGDGRWQTLVDPEPHPKAFYRLAVVDEAFNPGSLSPKWQLDATADFPSLANDAPVPVWNGSGISSYSQTTETSRPVYRDGSVMFDGMGDHLDFPMWSGGVGPNWTLALLVKVRPSISNYRMLCGGSFAAGRALELSWFQGDLGTRTQGDQDFGLIRTRYSCFPGESWRVLIVRSAPGLTRTRLDGIESVLGISLKNVGATGTFNLGCGYDGGTLSSPIVMRYAAFFPTTLDDDQCGKLERWMERKKQGEYPESQVFLAGGQSNYAYSYKQERVVLATAFPNAAVFPSSHFSATSLMAWMRDRVGGGYEVTPRVDVSEAPEGSRAVGKQYQHGGDAIIAEWQEQLERVRRNPKSLVGLLFTQGENDTDEAGYQWKPNGQVGGPVDYDAHYSDEYALASSYGPRSVAWNRAVRDALGFPNMVCIYERVNYVNLQRTGRQNQCEYIQRESQLESLANDPRYLLVDTSEIPREDGIHFTPDGATRFSRASVRLMKNAERLAKLPYQARMIAMRAIDSGLVISDAGMEACRTFVSSPEYDKLSFLFVPKLVAVDPVDQERLRRCNLMVHHSGRYGVGFLDEVQAHTTAYCDLNADQQALREAILALQTALGVSDTVVFPEE